jgi:hypothetical protein
VEREVSAGSYHELAGLLRWIDVTIAEEGVNDGLDSKALDA